MSIFNPISNQHHAIADFKAIRTDNKFKTFCVKVGIVALSALSLIFCVGVFRSLVGRFTKIDAGSLSSEHSISRTNSISTTIFLSEESEESEEVEESEEISTIENKKVSVAQEEQKVEELVVNRPQTEYAERRKKFNKKFNKKLIFQCHKLQLENKYMRVFSRQQIEIINIQRDTLELREGKVDLDDIGEDQVVGHSHDLSADKIAKKSIADLVLLKKQLATENESLKSQLDKYKITIGLLDKKSADQEKVAASIDRGLDDLLKQVENGLDLIENCISNESLESLGELFLSVNIQFNLLLELTKISAEQYGKSEKNKDDRLKEVASSLQHFGELCEQAKVKLSEKNTIEGWFLIEESDIQSPGNACSSFEQFCDIRCNGLDPEKAHGYVEGGKANLERILKGEKVKPTKEMASQIIWYLMDVALKDNQGFEEGTFVIEDKENRLYNFLLKLDPYERDSSHYKGRAEKKQRGLDLFMSEAMQTPLPALKRTLLFEKIKNFDGSTVLFIKPENYSANPWEYYDFAMHGKEFVEAQARKIFQSGGDDQPNMHKERVPSNVLKAFSELKIGDMAEAKKWGIAYMVSEVEELDQNDELAQVFKSTLNFSYNEGEEVQHQEYSHLDKRTGREVYLTQDDLFK